MEKMNLTQDLKFRNDIDGLRALAVMSVIAFHSGYLPNGFLGVDVFLVISGFFITKIILNKINNNKFSILEFYLSRIRRIIPLTLIVGLTALLIGVAVMLPDDMENLAQSVIATNFFSNNILQAITTKNYWAVTNEYKPLMHTWYLGVIGQYYLSYPLLLILILKKRPAWLLPVLSLIGCLSLVIYLLPYYSKNDKFYMFVFRFWEFTAGGIAAIALKNRLMNHKYPAFLILLLILILCVDFKIIPIEINLLFTVILTVGILSNANNNFIYNLVMKNNLLVSIGKISFGLYLWHQILLAYARYFWCQELGSIHLFLLYVITVFLAAISYFLIEKPLADKKITNNTNLIFLTGSVFFISSLISLYIYLNAGVIRDIPELDISKSGIVVRNLHAKYNDRVYGFDKEFTSTSKINILIIGNSFARDWANVLLESKHQDKIELSYIYNPNNHKELKNRVSKADIIFYSTPQINEVRKLRIPEAKLWVVGTKNFGTSSGIFYNYKGNDYYKQRTLIKKEFIDKNNKMKMIWDGKYIDYIGKVIDKNHKVPVFTPSNKFISQDTTHFTKAGAQYFAYLFEQDLDHIFAGEGK